MILCVGLLELIAAESLSQQISLIATDIKSDFIPINLLNVSS